MDPIILVVIAVLIALLVLNKLQKKKRIQKAQEIGSQIYDRIMAVNNRNSSSLPPADVYACAVGAFAANAGIVSTFTSAGEPLAKYKLRQMVYEYLPSKYKKDRVYFNCANIESIIFWIAYLEQRFKFSISYLYEPSKEWLDQFHEYFWKVSIYNMLVNMREPDIPLFLSKIDNATYVGPSLDTETICAFITRGTEFPNGLAGSDGSVFPGYDSSESYIRLREIVNSSICRSFIGDADLQARNLVSVFIPETETDPFDIDDDDRKLKNAVDQSWSQMSVDIAIPRMF